MARKGSRHDARKGGFSSGHALVVVAQDDITDHGLFAVGTHDDIAIDDLAIGQGHRWLVRVHLLDRASKVHIHADTAGQFIQ